jgi:PqqD family protein of HPr-rel-A system
MMSADRPRTWRIPAEADLRHRVWDGEHVFFHGAAGDTHRFSEAAALVLLALMDGPAPETRLSALLSEATGADDAEAAGALADILGELGRLECVESAP